MRTLVGILFQLLYMGFASGAVFMFTSVIAPLKPVISHPATHLPRMSIRFSDFSLPMAALEDEYNIGEMEDEVIPQNIPSRELRAGTVEMEIRVPVLRIPSLKVQANTQTDLTLAPSVFTKPLAFKEPQKAGASAGASIASSLTGINQPHFWIEGKIELTEGLALTSGTDKINVGWMVEGKLKKEGRVSIAEGRYSIKVEKLQGEVVAELADAKGYVMGEATIDLEKILRERGDSKITISNVDLRLAPYNFGFRARTLSVYDTPSSKSPVASTQVAIGNHDMSFPSNERGQVANDAVSAKSTAVLYANKGGYRETVVIADFTKEQNLRMFPEKYINALFNSIDLPKEFRDLGVVWGQVLSHGVAVGGYRVRFPQHPEITPVYFDTYIPMEKNKETSADGQYAFVGLSEGHYEIQVLDSIDNVIDTKLVYVKPAAVSTVEFETSRSKTVYVKYFDPFKTQPRPIEYVSLGGKESLTSETEQSIPISTYAGADPLLLFAKVANSKTESASFASRTAKYQEIPVLDHSWFDAIAQKYKIDKKAGAIVGFVDTQEHFEAYLDKSVLDYKVLYFDSKGEIIKKTDVGRQRAGFIFYNTSTDLHTVLIETTSGQIITELAYVDGTAVAVIFKSL
ncbi:MAG: hypothetical protein IT287_02230 [Bdellovibrionaceae bacterium]|nr:hypothetical protein [Pseudobdellovibrionaceae bacterium]